MKETFSLDEYTEWHSVDETCPIAGDYNKNIELACKHNDHARVVIDEYNQLIKREIDEYNNYFPYFSQELNKILYFSSRAKTLEVDDKNNVSILYGIIEDITIQEEQKQKVKLLSEVDKLTGLYNRHKIDNSLNIEIKRAKRHGTDLSLIILDIDKFKNINDKYGHLVGDKTLIEIATLLKENTRDTDIIGRWGGEEFIILCPNSNLEKTIQLAEKLRKSMESFQFDVVNNVTSSFGITQLSKDDDIVSFLTHADKALYNAKNNGRNRVEKY
ncbi:MAG: diguanylate cyclase [Sulfurimonas sp.]|nr:diguanylate cyclase [Sulfurimonas sp.]